jgi:predicted RND superfamily exporter protein
MRSIGFGAEQIGVIATRYPRRMLAAVAAFTLFCVFGLFHLQPEGQLSEIYRGNSQNYAEYEKLTKLFPASELDVMLLVSGKDLLSRKSIDNLAAIQQELEIADGVEQTLSIFTLHGVPDKTGYSAPLLPAEITGADDAAFGKALKAVEEHPDVYGTLLSHPDAAGEQTALFVLSLNRDAVREGVLYGVLDNLSKTAEGVAGPAGLQVKLAGLPQMQQEIRNAINHDMLVFNLSGVLLGVIISVYFIRRATFIFMTTLAAILANVWVFGIIGYFGQTINAFITIVPPLVIAISVSDGMHFVLDFYLNLRDGQQKKEALIATIGTTGKACVLTSLTTSLSFLSMLYTDSAVIKSFAWTGAMGAISAFVAVMTIVPALSMVMIRDESQYRAGGRHEPTQALVALEHWVEWFAKKTVHHWRPIITVCGTLFAISVVGYLSLTPRYNMMSEIPDRAGLKATMHEVDSKLGGGDTIDVALIYDRSLTATSPKVLEAVGEVHRLMASLEPIKDINSIESIRQWFSEHGITSIETLENYIGKMPDAVKRHYLNDADHAVQVSGRIANMDSERIQVLYDRINAQLPSLAAEYPGIEFKLSGLSTLATLQSTNMINELNFNLVTDILLVIALIGFAFRSFGKATLSAIPNLFPLLAAGAMLYLTGSGLQYASILGLILAFGIAVDDTIHLINRFHLEGKPGVSEIEQVENSMIHMGPALILTSLLLVCGLAVTMFSDLPVTRQFGQMTMVTLFTAVIAELFMTPSLIIAFNHFRAWLTRLVELLRSGAGAPGRAEPRAAAVVDQLAPASGDQAAPIGGVIKLRGRV